ncbi:MAG: energy transducer TonB [Pyrinomonadaceae bacterium]
MLVLFITSAAVAQRVAILAPDDSEESKAYSLKLESAFGGKVRLVDRSLAKAAFDATSPASPYNLSLDEAKHAGQAIGCDFFILVRSAVQRRSSFERDEYYDAYAFGFLVSSRTGRLIYQSESRYLENTRNAPLRKLDEGIPGTAEVLLDKMRSATRSELDEKPSPPMDEPPDEGSPAAKNFRPPVPFRRLKPEYTTLADQYAVTATVDMLVYLDAEGHVLRTEITRWAGYGLDGSVDNAIRSMNWRPAERDGKFIPMRFLVRYNFKKAATH